MIPIKVPITISPHIVEGTPRGYYILVHSLWKDKQPKIFKDQLAGFFNGCLILTMAHPSSWRSFIEAVIYASGATGLPNCWLAAIKMTRMGTGVRFYLPGTILKPQTAESVKVIGKVEKASYGSGDVIYVSVPLIDGDILLKRKEIKQ